MSSDGSYRIAMNGAKGKLVFSTIDEAKEHIFEAIESGKAGEYLAKHKQLPQHGTSGDRWRSATIGATRQRSPEFGR